MGWLVMDEMTPMHEGMSDEEEPRSDDEVFEELTGQFHAITILYNEDETYPEVDLGDVPPQVAITVMQQVIKALYAVLPDPVIKFNGNIIYDSNYYYDDEDDDDDTD